MGVASSGEGHYGAAGGFGGVREVDTHVGGTDFDDAVFGADG